MGQMRQCHECALYSACDTCVHCGTDLSFKNHAAELNRQRTISEMFGNRSVKAQLQFIQEDELQRVGVRIQNESALEVSTAAECGGCFKIFARIDMCCVNMQVDDRVVSGDMCVPCYRARVCPRAEAPAPKTLITKIPRDPLDGVSLIHLLHVDICASREQVCLFSEDPDQKLPASRREMTQAQRDAVSTHWSNQLRARIALRNGVTAERELRNRVALETDDYWLKDADEPSCDRSYREVPLLKDSK